MHELSVAHSIISSLEKFREKEGFKILRGVNIEIGRLAGVEIEALRFALQSIKGESILKEAEINLIPVGMKITCNGCGTVTEVENFIFQCSSCGGNDIEITGGDTLEITELNVD